MGVALGWIAVTLAGMAGSAPKEAAGAPISYTVQMVDTQGMGWREGVMAHLKPVTRQGATTVWTMPLQVMTSLVKEAQKDPACHVIAAPRVTAFSGVPATIQCRANRDLITRVSWNGDEIAPEGASEKVRLGWHTTFVGRQLDQGVLVKLVFEDAHIRAVHHVKLNRSSASCSSQSPQATGSDSQVFAGSGKVFKFVAIPVAGKSPFDVPDSKDGCMDAEGCCASGDQDASVRTVALEVPEIGSQEVAGEWLIPKGEFLLLSFGAYTVADQDGKAVVKERLAIIGAEEAADADAVPPAAYPPAYSVNPPGYFRPTPVTPGENPPRPAGSAPVPAMTFGPTAPAALTSPPSPVEPFGPTAPAGLYAPPVGTFGAPSVPVAPTAKPPLPMPAAPARSLPQGYHSDGTKAVLPPLPTDEMDDEDSSESSEPLASPQTKKPQKPKPPADAGTTKTAFPGTKASSADGLAAFFANPFDGLQFLMPLKPLSLKLPFNQTLELELRGRVVSGSP
jgi:hypothetical protein